MWHSTPHLQNTPNTTCRRTHTAPISASARTDGPKRRWTAVPTYTTHIAGSCTHCTLARRQSTVLVVVLPWGFMVTQSKYRDWNVHVTSCQG